MIDDFPAFLLPRMLERAFPSLATNRYMSSRNTVPKLKIAGYLERYGKD